MAGAPSRGDSSAAPPRPRSTLATAAKRLPGDNRRKLHPCAPPPRSRSPHLCLSHRAATPASADVFVHPSQEHPVFPPFDGSALCWAANLVLTQPVFETAREHMAGSSKLAAVVAGAARPSSPLSRVCRPIVLRGYGWASGWRICGSTQLPPAAAFDVLEVWRRGSGAGWDQAD